MGHRANLVLVQDGRASVRYDHWAAHNLSSHLVLGPEYTLRWVRQQESVDHHAGGGWLDELWCQGGLTMDLDRRRLTWFDIPTEYDLPRRAAVADLMARTWPEWTSLRAEGLPDLAAAAGVPGERVRHPDVVELITATVARDVGLGEEPPGSGRWCPTEDEPHYCLVTVARGDDLAVSLVDHACHAAWMGSALVDRVLGAPGATRSGARAVDLRRADPSGGVHVDVCARRMSYWAAGDTRGLAGHVRDRWDLDVVVLSGRFTEHLALTGGFVTSEAPDMAAAMRALAAELVTTHSPVQVHPANQVLNALTAVLGDVPPGVNPSIADHHPIEPTREELAAVVVHVGELLRRYGAVGGGPGRR